MLIVGWMDLEVERWFGDCGRKRKGVVVGRFVRLINL